MEFIKEFLDEGRSRIKSNVFASVVFAFVVLNWQPLYFVAFEKVDSVSKFEYFDQNTYWLTLYLLPLLVGGVLALGMPFINNLAHKVVSGTISAMRTRDDEHAHQRLKKKNEWEEERLRERTLYADKLISEAQIDQEIDDKIQDPKKREEIRTLIEGANNLSGTSDFEVDSSSQSLQLDVNGLSGQGMSHGAEVWLKRIVGSPYGAITEAVDEDRNTSYFLLGEDAFYDHGKSQDFGVLDASITELLGFGLLQKHGNTFSVTKKGRDVVDELESIPF